MFLVFFVEFSVPVQVQNKIILATLSVVKADVIISANFV
jgi:hypothetical protein